MGTCSCDPGACAVCACQPAPAAPIVATLHDGSFAGQDSIGLGGECLGQQPQYMLWDREGDHPVHVFTDMHLKTAREVPARRKVALLVEPPSLHDGHYRYIEQHGADFDYILTFDQRYVDGRKVLWYPLGGSWIKPADWGLKDKERNVSIIASFKVGAAGHRLRHTIIEKYGDKLDAWGSGYEYHESKVPMLAPYRYSVVVESCRVADYFSEKLIDCLSQGTVPIYWGCPNIGRYFDSGGILAFETLAELEWILSRIDRHDYAERRWAIEGNLALARGYRCAEDWIVAAYPQVFKVR